MARRKLAKRKTSGTGRTRRNAAQIQLSRAEDAPRHLASEPPQPTHRLLRGYAFDPSLATRLETALVSEITYKVPWERLEPGPIGEYVEVVDYDPPSACFYVPADLDHPAILAQ